MYLAAPFLDRVGVPKFVQGLDHRVHKPEQDEVLGIKDAISDVFGQIGPVGERQHRPGAYHRQPQEYPEPPEQGLHPGQGPFQKAIRIEHWKTQRQRRPQPAPP